MKKSKPNENNLWSHAHNDISCTTDKPVKYKLCVRDLSPEEILWLQEKVKMKGRDRKRAVALRRDSLTCHFIGNTHFRQVKTSLDGWLMGKT